MRFEPKTEDECRRVIPGGIYDFEVVEALDKVSKQDNEMISLKLKIYKGENCIGYVFDYLMEKIAYKLRHAAYTCGIGDKYENGDIRAVDFNGATGKVKIIIQKSRDPQYPADKNAVADYLTKEKLASIKAQPNQPEDSDVPPIGDEDLPF